MDAITGNINELNNIKDNIHNGLMILENYNASDYSEIIAHPETGETALPIDLYRIPNWTETIIKSLTKDQFARLEELSDDWLEKTLENI